MNTKVLAFLTAILLATSGGMASAQRSSCSVDDPTGTPLNVRVQPHGTIVGALHNGAQVFVSDLVVDGRGRRWAKIVPLNDGKVGWVFRDYLFCE